MYRFIVLVFTDRGWLVASTILGLGNLLLYNSLQVTYFTGVLVDLLHCAVERGLEYLTE